MYQRAPQSRMTSHPDVTLFMGEEADFLCKSTVPSWLTESPVLQNSRLFNATVCEL